MFPRQPTLTVVCTPLSVLRGQWAQKDGPVDPGYIQISFAEEEFLYFESLDVNEMNTGFLYCTL
jgi:hypothetical protein